MSYTSSDPEHLNRDPDTTSLPSTSTSASQLSKTNKKPWSKLKSSLKSLGKKMSSRPNFAEPTESSERRKSKKTKKTKESTSYSDAKPSSSEAQTREKSPPKGPKNLIKKLSVETIGTPFVGFQPSSVSPTTTYAKAVSKSSGSTSESNLSFSDFDSPKKTSTVDKTTKANIATPESPDSGRASQTMDESRPSSQVTEEGYMSASQRYTSDLSVDSDQTSGSKPAVKAVPFESLVAKTAHFAQSLVPPKLVEGIDSSGSAEFIKVEAGLRTAELSPTTTKPAIVAKTEKKKEEAKKDSASKSPETKTNVTPIVSPTSKADSLVAKTAHFVQSVVPPNPEKEKGNPHTEISIKGKTVKTPSEELPVEKTKSAQIKKPETKYENVRKDPAPKTLETKTIESPTVTKIDRNDKDDQRDSKSSTDEVEGRKKSKQSNSGKIEGTSASFIKSEQSMSAVDSTSSSEKSAKRKDKPTATENTEVVEVKPKKDPTVNVSEQFKLKDSSDKSSKPEAKLSKKDEKVTSKIATKNTEDKEEKPQENVKIVAKNEKKEKSSITDNSAEKEIASKSPLAASNVEPPTDLGPSSPPDPKAAQMSVEEKLEAFLSAEGWSGTIKDISNKPNADDTSQQPDKRECLYKILVIGELGTGKTSIIKRYVHQFFSQHYRATIGVDFALKVLNWDPNTIIRLQLWDIAGQERFGNMTRVYYKEAVGAFIVFDVTRSATFDAVLKWKQDLDSKVQLADGSPIPCVLLANKCDQQKEGIVNTPAKMDEFCKENHFSAWFETSAKENINIDEAAKSLVTQILQNDKLSQNGKDSAKDGKFPLDGKTEEESRSCAC